MVDTRGAYDSIHETIEQQWEERHDWKAESVDIWTDSFDIETTVPREDGDSKQAKEQTSRQTNNFDIGERVIYGHEQHTLWGTTCGQDQSFREKMF